MSENPESSADQEAFDKILKQLRDGERPDQRAFYPQNVWDEVKPGLWLGGTHDDHDLAFEKRRIGRPPISREDFDTVITLYAWALPADWFVKEVRLGIHDGDMSDFDMVALRQLVEIAHSDWRAGKRVLIRCQAGINRSGLVMALVLIRSGMSADKAIELMRAKRADSVLRNLTFETWLRSIKPADWRN